MLEKVTDKITTISKTTTAVHDVVNSIRPVTSPENRTLTLIYDPGTLLTLTSSVSGLFATVHSYFANGKTESVSSGLTDAAVEKMGKSIVP